MRFKVLCLPKPQELKEACEPGPRKPKGPQKQERDSEAKARPRQSPDMVSELLFQPPVRTDPGELGLGACW